MQLSGLPKDTYTLQGALGEGACGVVYLAYHTRLQKQVVLKRISAGGDVQQLRQEADVLKNLRHTRLPKVYDFLQAGGSVYTVMDYIEGYDLKAYLDGGTRFTQAQLAAWLDGLLEVLEYLAAQTPPVLHSDIKPANIMLCPNGDVCLIDFNVAFAAGGALQGFSTEYAAPELLACADAMLRGAPVAAQPDARSDIYSLGATFYHLASGIQPRANAAMPPLCGMALPYNEGFLRVVDKAMRPDPAHRWQSAAKMRAALRTAHRLEGWWRRQAVAQALLCGVCAVVLALGVFTALRGHEAMRREDFAADYNAFAAAGRQGAADAAGQGLALLNNPRYAPLLDDGTRAAVLHALGDLYWQEGSFALAAAYYGDAVSLAGDDANAAVYLLDCGMALAADRQTEAARDVLQRLAALPGAQASAALLEARLLLGEGEAGAALAAAAGLVETAAQPEERARAALLAADACAQLGEGRAEIEYLALAYGYNPTAATRRRLADTAGLLGIETGDTALLQTARGHYESLVAEVGRAGDVLNLAVVLRALGQPHEARLALMELEQQGGEDWQVAGQLALAYAAEGEGGMALGWCARAAQRYAAAGSPGEGGALLEEVAALKARLENER